ncbi:leukocyte receptor cluster member 1 [Ditylenchus destructor]|nr:leukocyte receptor cluster member 1 [Ditylenchus destructor]
MNILPKKKWHVRTKENMARVRRDEAKAAAEQKAIDDRIKLADNEDRIRRLKKQTGTEDEPGFFEGLSSKATTSGEATFSETGANATKHVNLFVELEEQERKNLAHGNKEYEAEKKKEQDDWESKMGIMKRFAEDTKEYSKEKYWWENIPLVRETVSKPDKDSVNTLPQPSTTLQKVEKKRKHSTLSTSSSSSSIEVVEKSAKAAQSASSSAEDKKRSKLEKLRAERLARERAEHERVKELLKPKKEEDYPLDAQTQRKLELENERNRKYNPQFNPDFVRQ